MVDVLEALQGAAFVSVILGASFTVYQLRRNGKNRRAELVIHLNDYVSSPEFMNGFLKVLNTEFETLKEAEERCSAPTLYMLRNFLETLSYVVRKKQVDPEPVYDLMEFMVVALREKMNPIIQEARFRYNHPPFSNFEYLANDMHMSRNRRRLAPISIPAD